MKLEEMKLEEKMSEAVNRMVIVECYVNGNMNELVDVLKTLDLIAEEQVKETEKYGKKVALNLKKLEIISLLIKTKKIEKNKQDFIVVAEQLKQIADDLIKISEEK